MWTCRQPDLCPGVFLPGQTRRDTAWRRYVLTAVLWRVSDLPSRNLSARTQYKGSVVLQGGLAIEGDGLYNVSVARSGVWQPLFSLGPLHFPDA